MEEKYFQIVKNRFRFFSRFFQEKLGYWKKMFKFSRKFEYRRGNIIEFSVEFY